MVDEGNKSCRFSNINDIEAAYILGMADAGTSHSQITSRVERDKSTITQLLNHYDYKSFVGVNKPPGRPRKTTERDNTLIVCKAIVNRRRTLSDITNLAPVEVSTSTMHRILKEAGVQKHIAAKKPFLTAKHIADRLKWALDSDVCQSSQTGESTGDRPAFWDFGSGSSYNSQKRTGSQITTVILSIELI